MIRRLLGHALGLTLFTLILVRHRAELTSAYRQDTSWPWLAIGALALVSMTTLTFVRLHLLLRSTGAKSTFPDVAAAALTGYASNLFLPGPVGGDVVKGTMLARRTGQRREVFIAVALDRAIGLVGLVAVAAAVSMRWLSEADGAPNAGADRLALLAMIAAPIALVVLVLVVRRTHRHGGIPWHAAVVAITAAVVGHGLLVVGLWCFARGLATPTPPLARHALVTPLALLSGALPLTPANLGVLEVAMSTVYASAGLPESTSTAMLVPYRVVQIVIGAVGLLVARTIRHGAPASNPRHVDESSTVGEMA